MTTKMTEEQIIRALESYDDAFHGAILDIIRNKNTTIEKLENIERYGSKLIEKQEKELERLHLVVEKLSDFISIARVDTIEWFAGKVIEMFDSSNDVAVSPSVIKLYTKNLVEELSGGNK